MARRGAARAWGDFIYQRVVFRIASPLSIEFPYSFACRTVESSIESSQSDRRVGLQISFFHRLMSPVFSVLDFPIVVHAAQSSRRVVSRNFFRPVSRNFQSTDESCHRCTVLKFTMAGRVVNRVVSFDPEFRIACQSHEYRYTHHANGHDSA